MNRNGGLEAAVSINGVTFFFDSLLDAEEKGSHVISPAWRPEGIMNVGLSKRCKVLSWFVPFGV